MDVKIEAAPMAAEVEITRVTVKVTAALIHKAVLPKAVASSSCPSISGHSISAVAPDHNTYLGGLANAA